MRLRLFIGFFLALFVGASLSMSTLAAAPSYSSDSPTRKHVDKTQADSTTSKNIQNSEKLNESKPVAATTPSPNDIPSTPRTKTVAVKGNGLSIPSIGLQAPVINVGTTADNAIDVPSGMQVGRWTGSALPGTAGAVFLDGHLDGIFARLNRLTVGQTLSLTYNNQTYTYRVIHTEVVALATIDMNRALSVLGGSEGLNLMTCAGTYTPASGTYDRRLVVYTVRVS